MFMSQYKSEKLYKKSLSNPSHCKTPATKRGHTNDKHSNPIPPLLVLSQNVAGWKKQGSNLSSWMAHWKTKVQSDSIDLVCLQETHITTPEQIQLVINLWRQVWGFRELPKPCVFLALSTNPTGGVGSKASAPILADGQLSNAKDFTSSPSTPPARARCIKKVLRFSPTITAAIHRYRRLQCSLQPEARSQPT